MKQPFNILFPCALISILFAACNTIDSEKVVGESSSDGSSAPEIKNTAEETIQKESNAPEIKTAVTPIPTIKNRATIVAGLSHTCVMDDEKVYCWGANTAGQLGNNQLSGTSKLVEVSGLRTTDVQEISLGSTASHTCVRNALGVECWGVNSLGQLSQGLQIPYQKISTTVSGLQNRVSKIASGGRTTCAIHNEALSCWGSNDWGQLGANRKDLYYQVDLIAVTSLPGEVEDVSLGLHHVCAIATGRVYCWGQNFYGQLGNGDYGGPQNPRSQYAPVQVQFGYAQPAKSITASINHTCMIDANDEVWCWGDNDRGQLGVSNTDYPESRIPIRVQEINHVTHVATGGFHTCVLKSDKTVYCWGQNIYGQLGNNDPDIEYSSSPKKVEGLDQDIKGLATGLNHTCTVTDKYVNCWGYNQNGELGVDPTSVESCASDNACSYRPVKIDRRTFVVELL